MSPRSANNSRWQLRDEVFVIYEPIKTTRLTIAPSCYFNDKNHRYREQVRELYNDKEYKKHLSEPDAEDIDSDGMRRLIERDNQSSNKGAGGVLWMHDYTVDQIVGVVLIYGFVCDEDQGDKEIVCAIHPARRRDHFAEEAVAAVIDYEFANGLARIMGRVSPTNNKSIGLVEKLGFTWIADRLNIPSGSTLHERIYELKNPGR